LVQVWIKSDLLSLRNKSFIYFLIWRKSESGPATPSREGRPILHYHLMIVEGPRNHHTTFWPKQKSCQLAFNLTFFYPIFNHYGKDCKSLWNIYNENVDRYQFGFFGSTYTFAANIFLDNLLTFHFFVTIILFRCVQPKVRKETDANFDRKFFFLLITKRFLIYFSHLLNV
jgi:hypothetical protein